MSWRPRITVSEATLCYDFGEAEGKILSFEWFGWIFELTIARHRK